MLWFVFSGVHRFQVFVDAYASWATREIVTAAFRLSIVVPRLFSGYILVEAGCRVPGNVTINPAW